MMQANELILPVVLIVIIAIGFSGALFLLRYDNRVPILGLDLSRKALRYARCRTDSQGSALWRVKGFEKGRIPLDGKGSMSGLRGPTFVADVTPGQFRVMSIEESGEVLRMPGDRLDRLVGAYFNKEIADSSKTDITGVLKTLIMAAVVVAFLVVGGLAYVATKV